MRIIATSFLIMVLSTFGWSQKEVILETNPVISKAYQLEAKDYLSVLATSVKATNEKALCTEPESDVISVFSGQNLPIRLDIDTFGLGGNGAFECIDCNNLSFGNANIITGTDGEQTDSLLFFTLIGVDAGLDTLHVQYCNADTCSSIQELVFLIRRRGESYYPATFNLQQEETVQIQAVNDLPGTMKCSFFIDCPDQYEGRDQLAYFADYSMPTNELVYHSSRFAGVDSVCVTLCDEFGICDTTHFAFNINVPSISFPFYDDFYSDSPYPAGERWLDKEVFINNKLAVDPPSVGVATFDGIDNRGRAYATSYGKMDRLTSTYIDVTTATAPNLSFWAQRGGYAERPERKDSLIVQFKDQGGNWISVLELKGLPSNFSFSEVDTFRFHSIPLGPAFQYNRFQFRFIGHADGTGYRDNWHIDYVRLDNNASADSVFNDISFIKEPGYILNNYTSLPWRHFQAIIDTELKSTIDVGVYNHFSVGQNANPSLFMMEELNSGVNPLGNNVSLFNGTEANIDRGVITNREYNLMGDATGFSNVWDNYLPNMSSAVFDGQDEVLIETTYSLDNNSQANIDFVDKNDQVSKTTNFSNYFAYDDGTAEFGLKAFSGQQFAAAYSAAVADTIIGVQFNFPHSNDDIVEQEFILKIWIGELDDTPEYSGIYNPVFPSTVFDTLHGFTSYQLKDSQGQAVTLAIPAGDFYVGWEQKTSCQDCIVIGYDINQPNGVNFIHYNNGSSWGLYETFHPGALMIRPVVGGGDPIGSTAVEFVVPKAEINVYPNPSRGVVYLSTGEQISEQSHVSVFNSNGQLLEKLPYQTRLNLSHLNTGIYFLEIFDPKAQKIMRSKVIVNK